MVIKSYFDAFRMIFAGWSFPRDPQTNFLKGSLDDMKAYYARFGERLGLAPRPPEDILNELGYQHLRMLELDASLAAFRYNTEVYPQSANVWDSLADGLEHAGKKDEALASYRQAETCRSSDRRDNVEREINLYQLFTSFLGMESAGWVRPLPSAKSPSHRPNDSLTNAVA